MRASFYALFFLFILGVYQPASAQTVPATCDGDFYNVLTERAWMEGARELEIAQHIILKADSVLQYSCFDQLASAAGSNVTFRNSSAGVNMVARDPANRYLNDNFNHTMGGGKSSISAGGCDVMNRIWDFLKCSNFDDADFVTFQDVAGADPRTLAPTCGVPGRWSTAIPTAFPAPGGAGAIDPVATYLGALDPTSCSSHTPIPTGIMVLTSGGYTQQDAVCVAPGCYYDGGGCQ